MWLKNRGLQKFGGGKLERFGLRLWSRLQFSALNSKKDPEVVKLLWQLHQDGRSLMTAFESFLVYSTARAQSHRPGDFAEVGVFKGASAKLICEAKRDKVLHLFDTFEGLPPSSPQDAGVHHVGQYAADLQSVQDYLSKYQGVRYYKGLFPETAGSLRDTRFAFANLDVDLYESTLACLEFFYPRMVSGGIILSHDYDLLVGVQKAFDDFFADKPEQIIEQPTTQCMVVKL